MQRVRFEGGSAPGTAFVTGAGSGIGQASAVRLHQLGYRLGLFDRDADALDKTAALLRDGAESVCVVGDVTSPEDLREAVDTTRERVGTIGACAACAGIEVLGPFTETTADQWSKVMAVNLMGVVNTAQAVLADLQASRGAFVAISSDAGTQGFAQWTAYCASKHAVIGFIRAMAVEFGPMGLRSNVVAPSMVETAMAERIFAEIGPDGMVATTKSIPMARLACAEEIAAVIVHLLSPEASFTNGLVYAVDGGETSGIVG
ncbi:SDR family NAD(P)-dependent oxidoreductase [Mycolicibacterium sp.]|uniref:SDR family NAD(P)-dependent oxidoreductase n=1 Tax=Mycolicibacterium sp. TaxID=2320850 RepID=UPI003D0DD91B